MHSYYRGTCVQLYMNIFNSYAAALASHKTKLMTHLLGSSRHRIGPTIGNSTPWQLTPPKVLAAHATEKAQ